MEKIPFDLVELEDQLAKEVIDSFISLHDNNLEYKTEYYGDINLSNDPLNPDWQVDSYHYLHEIVGRENISGIYINWVGKKNLYKILISATGLVDDVFIWFNNGLKAKAMFDKIREWKFGSIKNKTNENAIQS